MKNKFYLPALPVIFLAVIFIFQPCLFAKDIISDPKRPAPFFDHTRHETGLSDKGCGICHHVLDTKQNKLVYAEGEEAACNQCHLKESSNNVPALREAGHKMCTSCHRNLIKEKKPAGPTTCGECHRK
jgi:predicted CXXCH cytochrome family protein